MEVQYAILYIHIKDTKPNGFNSYDMIYEVV